MTERTKLTAKTPEAKKNNQVSPTRKTDFSQPTGSPYDHIMFLQRTIGNQAVQRLLKGSGVRGQGIGLGVQAKLRIGQPNDVYEQEADRVAEQVMRIPEKQHIADSPPCSMADSYRPSVVRKAGDSVSISTFAEIGHLPFTATSTGCIIQRQPVSKPPEFPNFHGLLFALERNVRENLRNYGHHFYRISILHPDRPDLMKEALKRYALGLNVLETSYRFAGFEESKAKKLAIGTGILFKGLTFIKERELVLGYQIVIGRGLKLEASIDLTVNPKDLTKVERVEVNFGFTGRF